MEVHEEFKTKFKPLFQLDTSAKHLKYAFSKPWLLGHMSSFLSFEPLSTTIECARSGNSGETVQMLRLI